MEKTPFNHSTWDTFNSVYTSKVIRRETFHGNEHGAWRNLHRQSGGSIEARKETDFTAKSIKYFANSILIQMVPFECVAFGKANYQVEFCSHSRTIFASLGEERTKLKYDRIQFAASVEQSSEAQPRRRFSDWNRRSHQWSATRESIDGWIDCIIKFCCYLPTSLSAQWDERAEVQVQNTSVTSQID